ncbi:hypothetical protein, partial [Acidiphilium rubrum]|uniref:hypothetical protein n=1 Tax=Acidiphilium rubrum TaxID=526 RepID=UPI001C378C91
NTRMNSPCRGMPRQGHQLPTPNEFPDVRLHHLDTANNRYGTTHREASKKLNLWFPNNRPDIAKQEKLQGHSLKILCSNSNKRHKTATFASFSGDPSG